MILMTTNPTDKQKAALDELTAQAQELNMGYGMTDSEINEKLAEKLGLEDIQVNDDIVFGYPTPKEDTEFEKFFSGCPIYIDYTSDAIFSEVMESLITNYRVKIYTPEHMSMTKPVIEVPVYIKGVYFKTIQVPVDNDLRKSSALIYIKVREAAMENKDD